MSTLFLVPHIEADDTRPILSDEAWDELDAALEAASDRRAPSASPEARRAANRVLGAPGWVHVDLSDADPHWHAHQCVSDETGACPTCTAYVAAGGVL